MLALASYGLISRKLKDSVLTGPLLFTIFGLIIGPAVLGLTSMQVSHGTLHMLAEITLILVLFSDAASIDLKQLRRDHNLPVRMLLIGMPLTIILGTLAAVVMFSGFSFWEAALLAAILAPTDAALGNAVVANPLVPVRIRQSLNVESGLNDGIALPFVLAFAAFASSFDGIGVTGTWLFFAAQQIGFGVLAGVLLGYVGGKLLAKSKQARWTSESAEGMIALGLAFGAFALAESVHGNGFIAAFTGGLTFGNTLKYKCKFLFEFTESEGKILTLLTFAGFGAFMFPEALEMVTMKYVLFALLALTVLRMLPACLALIGTGIKPATYGFLGWFGPRGLASILFVLLILEETDLENESAMFTIVMITVALSILLHGMSAGPAARWYGKYIKRIGVCAENKPVSDEPFKPPGE